MRMTSSRLATTLLLALVGTRLVAANERQQCDVPGSCSSSGCATGVCLPTADGTESLYRFGGTAQAYKPRAPVKATICDAPANTTATVPYRVATWPYRRASYSNSTTVRLPEVFLSVTLMTCGESKKPSSCCCHPWNAKSPVTATIEAWQARPDGSFSSLRPGVEDGVCRAQLESTNKGTFEFQTFPAGSYGSLGGLGPSGRDFLPYGEPVIHFLVTTSAGYAPTLVDVPIYFHWASLESRSFGWNDWRGPAWVRQKSEDTGYEITSWIADRKRRSISIGLNLFLQQNPFAEDTAVAFSHDAMCESLVYGLPSSFFREPMAVCASSMLDFFTV
eukprot:scaffold11843_cov152-Amphora_coffeaeformis.AAC.2